MTQHMNGKGNGLEPAGGLDLENGASTSHGQPSPETLFKVNEDKDLEALKAWGNVEGLASKLGSSTHKGLDASQAERSRELFGPNVTKAAPPANFFVLCWETAQDPIIILLVIAALVSTVLGAAIPDERAKNGWIEGVAIWVAVIVVVGVGAGNDFQKDRQFRKLNAVKDTIDIKVIRGGQQILVKNAEIVVGDILMLDTGDKVVADGIVIELFGLVIDEASLTGEADPIKKSVHEDPWVRSGTQVSEGSGKMLVVAVGENSEWGKTMALMQDAGDDATPLQEKLEVVAAAVGKAGAFTAAACFIAMLIKWCVDNKGFPIKRINDHGPVQFFLYAITIIVVAVPEGLPLAVTISLAYSMKKMMKDNNFVRVLAACETMGGATAICSDKTGTLTENRMTVVEGWFAGHSHAAVPEAKDLPAQLLADLSVNMAVNSKAFLLEAQDGGKMGFVGNRTECALLLLSKQWGLDYVRQRDEAHTSGKLLKLYGFSSARKMSCCVMRETNAAGSEVYKVYNKGAAEWVLQRCSHYFETTPGQSFVARKPLTEAMRKELLNTVTAMAARGLRCICLSQSELPLEDPGRDGEYFEDADRIDRDLTAVAIVGIKDPVRKEVPDAVLTCQRAGIVVRMVTGDNIHTARHIARECGILEHDEHVCMEGPVFRDTPEEEMVKIIPNLRVLARSSPEDKLKLVRLIKSLGEVVAVTGDGTNDAPALKESDVGLAMGIAGTEVAKEAADIIILDDNFSSIVKSVLWGRSVFNNIRKFLMFQLTVNFVALVTAFVGAVVGGVEPLNVLQLLWVNMIMDSMGALALATEDPTPDLLLMKPYGREEPLITPVMWKHIFVQGMYQLFWMFVTLYAIPIVLPERYEIRSDSKYYEEECKNASSFGPNSARAVAEDWCGIMRFCGFPLGEDRRNTNDCPLYANYWAATGTAMPGDARLAYCRTTNESAPTCPEYALFDDARNAFKKDADDDIEKDRYKSLSVLFNSFIFAQVFNEINARRINDELDIFGGILKSPIFIGVLVVTGGLQGIIMNTKLGVFFKVVPLDWKEWLATIAMGAGALPVSIITRLISRAFCMNMTCGPKMYQVDKEALANSHRYVPSQA